jgi:mannose-6-phosphate isomerase-like protein (cupin superfamily)
MIIEGNFEIGGLVVKQDDRYVVKDNNLLKNLILSSTRLNPDKQTTGHKHAGQEEVYLFVEGQGEMLLDEKRFPVKAGDIVLIEDGVFHRVYNTSESELYFVCVFDGRRKI